MRNWVNRSYKTDSIRSNLERSISLHRSYIPNLHPYMEVLQKDGLSIVNSKVKCRGLNFAFVALNEISFDSAVVESIDYFSKEEMPFYLGLDSSLLIPYYRHILSEYSFNLEKVEKTFLINLLDRDISPHYVRGLRVQRVFSKRTMVDFISALNFAGTNFKSYYESSRSVPTSLKDPFRLYTGYVNGKPLLAAEVYLNSGVATIKTYRRGGFDSENAIYQSFLSKILKEAKNQGYNTALLSSTDEDVKTMTSLGFSEHFVYSYYSNR